MQAKKSLGQNFLRSKSALKAIVDATDPAGDDIVLEIGPGTGALTAELLTFAGKVIAIEKDRRLIPVLREKFSEEIKNGKLDIVEKDILDFDPEILKFYDHRYKVAGNIPYYITGALFKKFLETRHQPQSATFLVQKEVAERIIAKDKKESLLSISVKAFGEPKYVKTVPRGAFSPMPKVDSAIIHIANVNKGRFKEVKIEEKRFFEILKKGFAHKRKLLIKNLGTEKEILDKCGIPQKARAEDLSIEEWVCLVKEVS